MRNPNVAILREKASLLDLPLMGQKFCEMLIEHGRLREITELTTVSRFVDQLGSNVQFNEFIELHYEARKQEQLSHAATD